MHWPVCRSNPSCARDYMPLPARCHDQHWRGKFSLLSLGLARPNHFPPTFLASLPRRSDSVLGEQSTAGAEGRGEPSVVSQSPLLLLPPLLPLLVPLLALHSIHAAVAQTIVNRQLGGSWSCDHRLGQNSILKADSCNSHLHLQIPNAAICI
jgi:hypothetical protein